MLIVLLILSTGAALTGIKIKQAFDEQRKLSDTQQVLNMLIMAQDLMLILDADVEVVLSHDPKTKLLVSQIFVEKPMNKAWIKLVERPLQLSVLRSFDFDDHHENPLKLRFVLGSMSQGMLTLSTEPRITHESKNKRDFKIYLPGYPSPLSKTINEEPPINYYDQVNQQLYPHEVQEDLLAKKIK